MCKYQPGVCGYQVELGKEKEHARRGDDQRHDEWRDHDGHDQFAKRHDWPAKPKGCEYAQCGR